MDTDYNLLREILLFANKYFDGNTMMPSSYFVENNFKDIDKNIVNHHLKMLINSGLLDGQITGIISIKGVSNPNGFDFTKTIIDEYMWSSIGEKLNPINDCPLRLVIETAYQIFKESKLV